MEGGQVLHTSENINQMLLLFRLRMFAKRIRLRTYLEKYLELVKKIGKPFIHWKFASESPKDTFDWTIWWWKLRNPLDIYSYLYLYHYDTEFDQDNVVIRWEATKYVEYRAGGVRSLPCTRVRWRGKSGAKEQIYIGLLYLYLYLYLY